MPFKAETGVKGRIDWLYLSAAAGLVLLGTLAVVSAASPLPYYVPVLERHFLAVVLGALLFLFGLTFNYQIYQDQAKVLYALVFVMMVVVLALAAVQRGQRSWIQFAFLSFQPAELARLGTILVLAALLDARGRKVRELSTIVLAGLIAGPVMGLILKQPDFSSTLSFVPIVLGMLFCAGASIPQLAAVAGSGLVAVATPLLIIYMQARFPEPQPGSWPFVLLGLSRFGAVTFGAMIAAFAAALGAWWLSTLARLPVRLTPFLVAAGLFCAGLAAGVALNKQIKGYQRNRLVAYVAPHVDILGASYNVHQSQIAIGSGGPFGKGLFGGTQSKLGFLPERHTDFIYAVVGEEMGFAGTGAILALYLLLIWRIVATARAARDRYGYLVCCGIAASFSFHLLLNVGMCLGVLPVAGVPLPMISYGGSSLVISLLSLGIVANIYSRRYALL